MSDKGILVTIVGAGGFSGCSCGGNCGETDQVSELNVAVRKQRKDTEVRYINCEKQDPPPALAQQIDEMHLEMPVTFINGRPAFQGGLPDAADLLEAVAELSE